MFFVCAPAAWRFSRRTPLASALALLAVQVAVALFAPAAASAPKHRAAETLEDKSKPAFRANLSTAWVELARKTVFLPDIGRPKFLRPSFRSSVACAIWVVIVFSGPIAWRAISSMTFLTLTVGNVTTMFRRSLQSNNFAIAVAPEHPASIVP